MSSTAGGPIAERPAPPPKRARHFATTVLAALVIWALITADIRWGRLVDAPQRLTANFRLMFTRMSWDDLPKALEAMWESIAMAWLGTLFAAVFAVPLAFAAAENLAHGWISFALRQVFNVLRAIPEIIIVLALIPLFGLSPTAGIITLGIGSIGTLSKLCTEVVESIDSGPIEAADAVGAGAVERLRWSVLPQCLPEIASFVLYRFEINIRVSAILGVVGVGGIGRMLKDSIEFRDWGAAGAALIVVVLGTIAVDVTSGAIRRRLIAGPGIELGTATPDVPSASLVFEKPSGY